MKQKNEEDRVWVTVSRTVNLGNYESHKIEAGYSQSIKEDEEPMELIQKAEAELTPFVQKRSIIVKNKKRKIKKL